MGAVRADTEQRNRRLDRFPGIPRLRPLSSHLCVNWKPSFNDGACLLLSQKLTYSHGCKLLEAERTLFTAPKCH